jgi:hypothetical protein
MASETAPGVLQKLRVNPRGVSDVGFPLQMNIFGGLALTREQFQSSFRRLFVSSADNQLFVDAVKVVAASRKVVKRSRNWSKGANSIR